MAFSSSSTRPGSQGPMSQIDREVLYQISFGTISVIDNNKQGMSQQHWFHEIDNCLLMDVSQVMHKMHTQRSLASMLHSSTWHHVNIETKEEHRSNYELMIYTPYLTLKGELWGTYWEHCSCASYYSGTV